MPKTGRPRGSNNKEYIYTLRMDEITKQRLELYCKLMKTSRSEALRTAINNLGKENSMNKLWDITIAKTGSVVIEADTEEEALRKVELANASENIKWEDGWNAVDICAVQRQ